MRYFKIYDDGRPEPETETKDDKPLYIMPKIFTTRKSFREYLLEKDIKSDHTLSMLYKMGLDTSEKQYPVRLDIVQKWWGLWGLMLFKTGYEQRGK